MFKSKTKIEAFDRNNLKVKNLDPKKAKSIAKDGVKKLKGNEGEKTPYHMIINYFRDDSDKPLGDFIDFGINPRMRKHFLGVELKSGKLDKSMSKTNKEASAGMAYVKKINKTSVLHIEPDPKCKMPVGKWPKYLKQLKPLFGGMKAIAVIAGQVIEAEKGNEESQPIDEDTQNEESQPIDEDTQNEESQPIDEDAQNEESQPTIAPAVIQVKELIKDLAADLKGSVKEVTKNIKRKQTTEEDKIITESILDKFIDLEDSFEEMADEYKAKLQAGYDSLIKFLPQIEQIRNILNTGSEEDNPIDKETRKFLRQLRRGVNKFQANFKKLKKNVEDSASEGIQGGEEFLEDLF